MNVQICIFAYNLETSITRCIENIIASSGKHSIELFIMINGCSDKTLQVVEALAIAKPNIHPVQIALGDKANAWNVFCYDHYDPKALAIFADGDLTFEKDAITNLIAYHLAHPQYNAISSFPCEHGRSSQQWRKDLLSQHQFTGALYLLAPHFIAKLIDNGVKLPIGLIGDDSMLGFLSATDICSGTDYPKQRIGVCTHAIFNYEPLNPFRWQDCKLYLRRRIRYSLRHFQQSCIVSKLKLQGITAMPRLAIEATNVPLNRIRWFSSNLVFDLIAKSMIDKQRNQLYTIEAPR